MTPTPAPSRAQRLLAIAIATGFGLGNAAFFGVFAWKWAQVGDHWAVAGASGALALASLALTVLAHRSARLRQVHGRLVEESTRHLDDLVGARPLLWIALLSALALFVELSIIRWTGAYIAYLSQFRNYSLLACFLGLGLGFCTGERRPILLPYLLPLVALQFLQAALYTNAPISALRPVLPAWQFALIVAAAIPPGQMAGRALARESSLRGYGANLVGSLGGVLAANVLAALWLPPYAWLLLLGLIYVVASTRRVGLSGLAILVLGCGLAWLSFPRHELEVYSPYQRLVLRGEGLGHQLGDGRYGLFANGNYYQTFPAIDTSRVDPARDIQREIPNADLGPIAGKLQGARVLALGTGAGANLPALLRAGVKSVVAVDIDPAIVELGRRLNAEQPYADPRVRVVVDDARAYLRRSTETFDLIFFFWIDSLPGVSSSAGFRIDSFVYTRECFQDCSKRLAETGQLLVYAWMSSQSGKMILRVMTDVFGDRIRTFQVPPHKAQYLFTVGDVDPTGGSKWVVPLEVQAGEGPLLTDDWPFLYVEHRQFQRNIPLFLAMVLVLSLVTVFVALPRGGEGGGRRQLLVFFLFGAAFMMMETIGIMQLSLLFGHTWQVIGIVICGILSMAFVGNVLVERGLVGVRRWPWATGLVLSLLALWLVRVGHLIDLLGSSPAVSALYVGMVSFPFLFSSILFSTLVRDFPRLDQALGINLLGAMVGGCLEYAAMLTGYQGVTAVIPLLYLLALGLWPTDSRPAEAVAPASD